MSLGGGCVVVRDEAVQRLASLVRLGLFVVAALSLLFIPCLSLDVLIASTLVALAVCMALLSRFELHQVLSVHAAGCLVLIACGIFSINVVLLQGVVFYAWITLCVYVMPSVGTTKQKMTPQSMEKLCIEHGLYDQLFSALFDATVVVTRDSRGGVMVTSNAHKMRSIVGRELDSRVLDSSITDGVQQLEEMLCAATHQQQPVFQTRLLTWYDAAGWEVDCEVRALRQVNGGCSESASLLCGLRVVGEKRQRVGVWSSAENVAPATRVRGWRLIRGTLNSLRDSCCWASKLRIGWLEGVPQWPAWEILRQQPDACALWCLQKDLSIVDATLPAVAFLGVKAGDSLSSVLIEAEALRSVRGAVEEIGSGAQKVVVLSMVTSQCEVVDVEVTLVALPRHSRHASEEAAAFLIIRPFGNFPLKPCISNAVKSGLESITTQDGDGSSSISPDDSASLAGL